MPGSALNPGIVATVEWLNQNGYRTTDSGDGKTHDYACDQAVPYVHMQVEPRMLVEQTDRLVALLAERGVKIEPMNEEGTAPAIEAAYLPANNCAIITLWNVMLGAQSVESSDSRP